MHQLHHHIFLFTFLAIVIIVAVVGIAKYAKYKKKQEIHTPFRNLLKDVVAKDTDGSRDTFLFKVLLLLDFRKGEKKRVERGEISPAAMRALHGDFGLLYSGLIYYAYLLKYVNGMECEDKLKEYLKASEKKFLDLHFKACHGDAEEEILDVHSPEDDPFVNAAISNVDRADKEHGEIGACIARELVSHVLFPKEPSALRVIGKWTRGWEKNDFPKARAFLDELNEKYKA